VVGDPAIGLEIAHHAPIDGLPVIRDLGETMLLRNNFGWCLNPDDFGCWALGNSGQPGRLSQFDVNQNPGIQSKSRSIRCAPRLRIVGRRLLFLVCPGHLDQSPRSGPIRHDASSSILGPPRHRLPSSLVSKVPGIHFAPCPPLSSPRHSRRRLDISGLIALIVPPTIDSTRETSEIGMLSKVRPLSPSRGESNPTHEFVKARIRMEFVQTLIHRHIRE
jgi:hypothetical protein